MLRNAVLGLIPWVGSINTVVLALRRRQSGFRGCHCYRRVYAFRSSLLEDSHSLFLSVAAELQPPTILGFWSL